VHIETLWSAINPNTVASSFPKALVNYSPLYSVEPSEYGKRTGTTTLDTFTLKVLYAIPIDC